VAEVEKTLHIRREASAAPGHARAPRTAPPRPAARKA
jgi:hypothetical protein